jgi:hypothetical protein
MDAKFFMQFTVPLSILLPIFLGLVKYRRLRQPAKIILLYVIVSAVANGFSIIISKYGHMNNMPVVHVYTVVEILIIISYYKAVLEHGKKNNLYLFIAITFTVVSIVNALFFQSIYLYNSYTRSLEAIICLLFAINYFAKSASTPSTHKVLKEADFYFNAGFFLYFSGALMLFIFSNFVIQNLKSHDYLIIWAIHAGLVLLMYLLFSIGFLLCKK